MSRYTTALRLLLLLGLILVGARAVTAAPFPTPYHNGFENPGDASGTGDDTMSEVTQVASGTDGITSASGSFHATTPLITGGSPLAFTRLGGYQSTFPANGYTVSIDIYLDTAVSGISEDKRLDWSSAVNNPAGTHRRDFVFSIGTNGSRGFVMSVSNNTPGWPGNPARDPYTITTSGWYTFKHSFRNNSGVLAVDMSVLDSNGTVLKTWTLSDASDTIGTNVGGNRYGWMVNNAFANLPIDNVTRSGACTSTCYADAVDGDDANDGITPATAKKTIQAAVNAVDTNGTVIVAPGTYAESVTVNKSVTINGANAGVSPNNAANPLNPNAARGAESEITVTGANRAFSIGAANVTIDGFKFTNTGASNANVNEPLIGAGANFGGDAPDIQIINNLFVDTSRVLVTFNGPTQMSGGTIDNNRVENPTRPATGCGTPPAIASGACGYQLFNPWRTDDLSFQHNVAFAPAGNLDRVRTINVSWSTNVLIAYNTLRYTCIFTCFSIPLDASPVEVAYNDAVTDAGQVLATHPTWTTGMINVHHNIMTTGNDFPISIDNETADLDNVHINRNAISGTGHVRNGKSDLTIPGAETLDATCNWWGSAAGPNPANFFGPSEFTPWLKSSDLDGPCVGTIYVSTEKAGSVAGVGAFSVEDILSYNPNSGTWSMFFDGSSEGLTKKHNINGMQVNAADDLYFTFFQNKFNIPGISGKLTGHDIVHFDGNDFSLYFDGSDVDLTTTGEKLDGMTILDGSASPIGSGCDAYLLVSTVGNGRLKDVNNNSLKFQGEDILGFCATSLGDTTAGVWHLALDGSAEGMPKNSTYGLSTDSGIDDLYLITKAKFNVDAANGDHSEIFRFNGNSFSGPIFSAPDEGLNRKVNAFDIDTAN